jgi:hypothetical protein
MIKHLSCPGGDAMGNLGQGDAVTVFLKAKGSPANVEKHFEFPAGKTGHEGIKKVVGNLGGIGKRETRECGLIRSRHKNPPATRQAVT